ncbi:hypothetical protein ILYODFUR_037422 [Ilyodon furcidens]|uniref:Uncharacterized protein n=1 Tax=Ilyodon furcidens TaxID=33524 RepID=A0ABV0TH95_9TELE
MQALIKEHLLKDRVQVLLKPRSPFLAPVLFLGVLLNELDAKGEEIGLPPGVTVVDRSFQGATTVKVTVESNSEAEEDCEDEDEEEVVKVEQTSSSLGLMDRIPGRQFDRIQMELKECRLRLAEECRARLKAESRLMEYELENARLRDANRSLSEALVATGSGSALRTLSALEDEAVLESIENSFNKFHAFLDLLKDAGWVCRFVFYCARLFGSPKKKKIQKLVN